MLVVHNIFLSVVDDLLGSQVEVNKRGEFLNTRKSSNSSHESYTGSIGSSQGLCGCLPIVPGSTDVTLTHHEVTQRNFFCEQGKQDIAGLVCGGEVGLKGFHFPAHLGFLGAIAIRKMVDQFRFDFVRQIACVMGQFWMCVEVSSDFRCLMGLTVGFRVLDNGFKLCERIMRHNVPPLTFVVRFFVHKILREEDTL